MGRGWCRIKTIGTMRQRESVQMQKPPEQTNLQHNFDSATQRCTRCHMQQSRLAAFPYCFVIPDKEIRRIEEDGIVIEGPEA
jgi:hypothetical protein